MQAARTPPEMESALPRRAYVNAAIYTVNPSDPWAEAMLVEGSLIRHVGSREKVLGALGNGGEIVDLDGLMVLPGLHDAHVHLLFSGRKFRWDTRLTAGAARSEVLEELRAAAARPGPVDADGNEWIIAGEYVPSAMGDEGLTREHLDELFPDRPVFVHDYSLHGGVANSRALQLAGIDHQSTNPDNGGFVRDPCSGELTGELVEKGKWPLMKAMPQYSLEKDVEAVSWALDMCHRFGITSMQEASATPQALNALRQIDQDGRLRMYVAAHLVWLDEGIGMTSSDYLDDVISRREEWQSDRLDTRFVKVWLDGAPLRPHMTEAGISPEGQVDSYKLHVSAEKLVAGLETFDAAGLTVKMHCAGAGAVRTGLNAVEVVRLLHPGGSTIHEIAHCTHVDEADLDRFAQLGVTAEMSPAIWHDPRFDLQAAYRFRSLKNLGATMVYGSDWKITETPNPFPGLQGMVEHGAEALTLAEAIEILTVNGARELMRELTHGTIEEGKAADFVILDRNLFEIPTSLIGSTAVLATYIDGRPVYETELIDGKLCRKGS